MHLLCTCCVPALQRQSLDQRPDAEVNPSFPTAQGAIAGAGGHIPSTVVVSFLQTSCCLGTPAPSFRTWQGAVPRGVPCFAFMQDQLWPQRGVVWATARLSGGGLVPTAYPTDTWLTCVEEGPWGNG